MTNHPNRARPIIVTTMDGETVYSGSDYVEAVEAAVLWCWNADAIGPQHHRRSASGLVRFDDMGTSKKRILGDGRVYPDTEGPVHMRLKTALNGMGGEVMWLSTVENRDLFQRESEEALRSRLAWRWLDAIGYNSWSRLTVSMPSYRAVAPSRA